MIDYNELLLSKKNYGWSSRGFLLALGFSSSNNLTVFCIDAK